MIKLKWQISKLFNLKLESSFIKDISIKDNIATVSMKNGKNYVYYISNESKDIILKEVKNKTQLGIVYNKYIKKNNKSVAKY